MNNSKPDNYSEIVCHCSGTTEGKIKELLAGGGHDLDSLSRKTGVCSGCGACEDLIQQLLADYG
ncbi:MAG: (2Fe-2S)-binding protein [Methylococcaceae bacterium]